MVPLSFRLSPKRDGILLTDPKGNINSLTGSLLARQSSGFRITLPFLTGEHLPEEKDFNLKKRELENKKECFNSES